MDNELRGIPDHSFQYKTYPCRKCEAEVQAKPSGTNPVHGIKLACIQCGVFVGWSGYNVSLRDTHNFYIGEIKMENLPNIQTQDIQPAQHQGLVLAGDPAQNLEAGRKAAKALMDFAAQGGALIKLQGKQYLKAEGWLFLARAFGLTVRIKEVAKVVDDPLSFQATAEVLDGNGHVVGAGIGFCGADEKSWKSRPVYALASMAQTRATSKALRGILSWVAVLAGCEPTPGEEVIDATWVQSKQQPRQQSRQQYQPKREQPAPATPAQITEINNLSSKLNLDQQGQLQRVNAWLASNKQEAVTNLSQLTHQQATGLVQAMKKTMEKQAAVQPPAAQKSATDQTDKAPW